MSILDTVLSRTQSEEIENFQPQETLEALLRLLSDKEQEVLRLRYGLRGHEPLTLEEIGTRHGVTRERIRQIERTALQKLLSQPQAMVALQAIEALFRHVLEGHGGALTTDRMYRELFSDDQSSVGQKRIVDFFLSQLLKDKIVPLEAGDGFRPGWKLKNASVDELNAVHVAFERVFSSVGGPMKNEELFEKLRTDPFFVSRTNLTAPETLTALLELDAHFDQNPYGEWGSIAWGSIVPKRMYDKILLVLQKSGSPLHFQEITKCINDAHFDSRVAYAPTVHNELILSKDFVLVGRGMYALSAWGYTKGPVADVVERLLTESGEPMERDEIVRRVLEQRMVKKNTIHLALMDKERFSKLEDGRYTLSHGHHH